MFYVFNTIGNIALGGEVATGGDFFVDQENVYFFSKAGSDSNSGLNPNEAFLTIKKAADTASDQTPSVINQFALVNLDGGRFFEPDDLVLGDYVSIYAPGAQILANIIIGDDCSIVCSKLFPRLTSPFDRGITKSQGGSRISTVYAIETWDFRNAVGVKNTSAGHLIMNAASLEYSSGTCIDPLSTGKITTNCSGRVLGDPAESGKLLNHTTAGGKFFFNFSEVVGNQDTLFSSIADIECRVRAIELNAILAGGQIYDFSDGTIYINSQTLDETVPSVTSGSGAAVLNIGAGGHKIRKVVRTASVTAPLSDKFHVVEFDNDVNDYTYTLPAFSVGSWMEIRRKGTGEITIAKDGGITFDGSLGDVNVKIDGSAGFSIFVEVTAANTWLYSGSVKAV